MGRGNQAQLRHALPGTLLAAMLCSVLCGVLPAGIDREAAQARTDALKEAARSSQEYVWVPSAIGQVDALARQDARADARASLLFHANDESDALLISVPRAQPVGLHRLAFSGRPSTAAGAVDGLVPMLVGSGYLTAVHAGSMPARSILAGWRRC